MMVKLTLMGSEVKRNPSRRKRWLRLLCASAALPGWLASGVQAAPRSFTAAPITENFDGLGIGGTVVTPLVGWDAGQFNPVQAAQPGPGDGIATVTATLLQVDDGTVFLANGTASIGNLGTSGSTDRALGGMPNSASGDLYHQLAIKNDSGNPITSFVLSYTGEQWANAPSTNPDSLTVWFSDNNASSGFVTMGTAFTFTAPHSNASGAVLDGNAAANRTAISGTFTPAIPVAAGNTFYIRWYDKNDGTQDHVLALDDLTVTPAAYSGALSFDGANDYVTMGAAPGLGATNFTLECWMRIDGAGVVANSGTGGIDVYPLIDKGRGEGDGSNVDCNYIFGVQADNRLAADFEDFSSGLNHPVIGTAVLSTGVWHHCAVTYDGSWWRLYIDGVADTSLQVTGGGNIQVPRYDSIQHFALGTAMNSSGVSSGAFKGLMDEVRVWNRARTAAEISSSMNSEIAAATNLLGRWSLNETSGTSAVNTGTSAANGTLVNGPVWTAGHSWTPAEPQPPAVAITSPAASASVGTSFTISATAADSDGTITSVAFYDGATLLGTDTASPYSFNWTGAALGSHTLTAIATDNSTMTTTSAAVMVTVVSNLAPSVAITSPANGAGVGTSFTITATAADSDGTITSVAFYDGATLLGSDATSPYSFAWNGVPLGSHVLTAQATDDGGLTTSSAAVNVLAATGPVTLMSQNFSTDPVNYTLPGNSSPFRFDAALTSRYWAKSDLAGLTLNAGVTGNVGPYLATQNIDGNTVTFSDTAPAQIDFTVAAANYGSLKLSIALAAMPTAETINFIRAKTDNNGDGTYETTLFEFKGSNNSAYTDGVLGALTAAFKTFSNVALPAPTAADGKLRLRLESFNDTESLNEATGIDSIVISGTTLGPVVPPTVALTAPVDAATVFVPGTTNLAATASDADGTVSKVEFFDGATKLGEDSTSPYTLAWTPAALGSHTLTAVATDNVAASAISAAVTVTAVPNPNQPPVVAATAPGDETAAIGASTMLSVSLADPEGDASTVTFYGRKTTPLAPGPDFSLIAIPDTQFYSENTGRNPSAGGSGALASIFSAQTQWIVDNRSSRNIAFVSHMGDIVQNGDFSGNPVEWQRADTAMKTLENQSATLRAHGIPWGGAPGNHDSGTGGGTGTTAFFNQYFGTARFAGRNYYGGNYGTNNNNNYELFSASGLDFIVIHLEYNTGALSTYQAVLDWADALLKTYPNRRAIVTSHWVVNTGNPASFSTQGQNIYNELKDNPNLFLMLCGHVTGEGRRSDTDASTGRTVHSVLQDYQDVSNGGNGFLRIFSFSPANNQISVESYSPTLGRAVTAADNVPSWSASYGLAYPMQGAITDWIPLGAVNVAAGGTTANLNWTGLEAGARYEWYASANDGISSGSSATLHFSTTVPVPPSVSLTGPAEGASYEAPAPILLSADASDADGTVVRVEFYAGATKLGEDSSAPYEFSWTSAFPGSHALAAVAVDNSGSATLSAQVNVTTTGVAPTITLTAPAAGATTTAPASVNLAATAADGDGTVAKVEFFQGSFKIGEDLTEPFAFVWANVAPGTYQLSAVATDSAGIRTTSATVSHAVNAGASSGTITRGPYLQKAAPTQMTVCWRGSASKVGRVRYGTSLQNLNQFKDDAAAPASPYNHVITLTGLTAATTYYYSVGSATDTLVGGADYTFITPPVPGTVLPTRIWALGDAGTADGNQTAVRDAFYNWTGTRVPNLVLQLGDNAYDAGTDTEFQNAMFNIYPTMLRKTPFWSCLGNHETAQSTAYVDTYPYFSIYTLPTAGECGGIASGTEHYYSFDYGNIHCIALDSMTASRASNGAMAVWLQNDLASTTATWIICFFHHPPYTKGSHNSDTEGELIQMRQNLQPILEAGGVDLVLAGHSHCYERSYLLDGHYGLSTTLTAAMKKNAGSGRPSGTGAYIKPLSGPRDHFGTVYAVAGSAGKISGGSLNHPAHFISLNNLGSLVLDVNGSRLDATFLRENSSTPDTFTIIKQGAADSDKDGIPDEYEISHGLDRKNPADAALDSDGDGVSNLNEFILATASNVPDHYTFSTTYDDLAGTATVTFPTVVGRYYRVLHSDTLLAWQTASASIAGTGTMMSWTDDGSSTGSPPGVATQRFYRIEVVLAP
jgi:hypothetical protein